MSKNRLKKPGPVKIVTVDHYTSQRLDNFLFRVLKGLPKSRIYRAIRKGEVRVNGGRVRGTYRISFGDRIRIPPIYSTDNTKSNIKFSNKLVSEISKRIIFENNDMLIIDKPHGLAVHGGSGLSFGLIELLRYARPENRSLELVHRLDRDTSGLLITAKTQSCLKQLHELFREQKIDKRYLALVHGRWPRSCELVSAPIKKNILNSGERVSVVSRFGKPAVTKFRIVQKLEDATLIEARPVTGRTHQIRVHARHVGHAIIGDQKYFQTGYRETGLGIEQTRLFLHAHRIRFSMSEERVFDFSSDLDDQLGKILSSYE